MRYLVTAAALTAVGTSLLATPAQARDRKLCKLATMERKHVVKRLDKMAPGRNICENGTRTKIKGESCQPTAKLKKARRPTSHEKACYLRNLRNLAHPHPLLTEGGAPRLAPAGTQSPRAGSYLNSIAQCESNGNSATNTGNGFYGKYQFTQQSWAAVGGTGLPSNASEAEQDQRAAALMDLQGPGAWPVCSR